MENETQEATNTMVRTTLYIPSEARTKLKMQLLKENKTLTAWMREQIMNYIASL